MIQALDVNAIEICGSENLDPIKVYWEDFGERRGQVTITCWGEAWTAYWGAMPELTIREFFLKADVDYIANRLQGAQFQKHTAGHMTYLKRIVRAVKEAIAAPSSGPQKILHLWISERQDGLCEQGNPGNTTTDKNEVNCERCREYIAIKVNP